MYCIMILLYIILYEYVRYNLYSRFPFENIEIVVLFMKIK